MNRGPRVCCQGSSIIPRRRLGAFLPFMSPPSSEFLSGSDSRKEGSECSHSITAVARALGVLALHGSDDLVAEIRLSPQIVHGCLRRSHGSIKCAHYKLITNHGLYFATWRKCSAPPPRRMFPSRLNDNIATGRQTRTELSALLACLFRGRRASS